MIGEIFLLNEPTESLLFTIFFPQWTEKYLKKEVFSFYNFCTPLRAWGPDKDSINICTEEMNNGITK